MSVVIAAYNCAEFIDRAVRSALAQQGVEVEVLIVNDASTDVTQDVIEYLACTDQRVRVLTLDKNGGPSVARNLGLKAATGEWIAILDADDEFSPGRLEHLINVGIIFAADIVTDNFSYYNAHTGQLSRPAIGVEPLYYHIDLYNFLHHARPYLLDADFGLLKPMFRANFLRGKNLSYDPNVRHAEDFELIFYALLNGGNYIFSRSNIGYHYTTRESGRSRTQMNYKGMVDRARGLLKLDAVRGDHKLIQLVHGRIKALQRLELDWLASLPIEVRPRAQILHRAIGSSVGRRWLVEKIVNKFGG